METIHFKLEGPHIELIQLLKAVGIAQTGGHAKIIVEEGEVIKNGEIETRKRAKIIKEEIIIVNNEIEVIID